MGIDSILVRWSDYQALGKPDLDAMSFDLVDGVMADMLEYVMSNGIPSVTNSSIVTQDTGSNYQTKVAVFWGIADNGAIVINSSQKTNIHDVPSTNPRVDIIEVQRKYIGQTATIKYIVDPITGALTPYSTYSEYAFDIDVQVTKGAESATPVAPVTTSGWMKIAEVLVDIAGGIADTDVFNVDKTGLEDNTGWTTEKRGTILLNSIYERQTNPVRIHDIDVHIADFTARVNTIHYVLASSVVEITMPTTGLIAGQVIKIIGITGGWIFKENFQFFGYKGYLRSIGPTDFIELMYTGTGWVMTDKVDERTEQYGFWGGGYIAGGVQQTQDELDYLDLVLLYTNAFDRGDLVLPAWHAGGCSSHQYGFIGGGWKVNVAPPNEYLTLINYFDKLVLTGNAADRGDLTYARYGVGACAGLQYGFWGGGSGASDTNIIDYIDVTILTGNAVDRGDLLFINQSIAGMSSTRYGYWSGGGPAAPRNNIQYIDMAVLTGNSIDGGDLSAPRSEHISVSNNRYGFFVGARELAERNLIEYMDMVYPTSNAIDRGNSQVGDNMGGTSGDNQGAVMRSSFTIIDMTILSGWSYSRGTNSTAEDRYNSAGV